MSKSLTADLRKVLILAKEMGVYKISIGGMAIEFFEPKPEQPQPRSRDMDLDPKRIKRQALRTRYNSAGIPRELLDALED